MSQLAIVPFICLLQPGPVQPETRSQPSTAGTWYERILPRINPDDIDYGAMWEERKREFVSQLGNPYVQYSHLATVGALVLLTMTAAQRHSYRRELALGTQSLTGGLR